jgi:predicted HicB family RNase H-like nuclease
MARPKREDGRNPKTVASNKYNEKAYDRINYTVQAGYKQVIKDAADKSGLSVNAYITKAIEEKIDRDGMI